jgi:hypothetical protein
MDLEGAQRSLPIYMLTGSEGFVWMANRDNPKEDFVRFLAADPSRLMASTPAKQKLATSATRTDPAGEADRKPPPAAKTPAERKSKLPHESEEDYTHCLAQINNVTLANGPCSFEIEDIFQYYTGKKIFIQMLENGKPKYVATLINRNHLSLFWGDPPVREDDTPHLLGDVLPVYGDIPDNSDCFMNRQAKLCFASTPTAFQSFPVSSSIPKDLFDEVPFFTVDSNCRSSLGSQLKCIHAEQDAFERLRSIWPISTEAAQKRCGFVASENLAENYQTMALCLTDELNRIAEQNRPKTFHYH